MNVIRITNLFSFNFKYILFKYKYYNIKNKQYQCAKISYNKYNKIKKKNNNENSIVTD